MGVFLSGSAQRTFLLLTSLLALKLRSWAEHLTRPIRAPQPPRMGPQSEAQAVVFLGLSERNWQEQALPFLILTAGTPEPAAVRAYDPSQ